METHLSFMEKLFFLRSEIHPIAKKQMNSHFGSKYFDINQVLEMIDPLLFKYRLMLLQPIKDNIIWTIIRDIDLNEEKIYEQEDSFIELPKDLSPQRLGAAITYYRRYTLVSLLGLGADDDNGNTASFQKTPISKTKNEKQLVSQSQNAKQQKPTLILYDHTTKNYTKHYTSIVNKMLNEGLTKEKVLSHFQVSGRNATLLDEIFNMKK